jgi:hypothetical protein
LGLTRIEFLALLRRRGIAYVDYSPAEIAEELAAVNTLLTSDASVVQGFLVQSMPGRSLLVQARYVDDEPVGRTRRS